MIDRAEQQTRKREAQRRVRDQRRRVGELRSRAIATSLVCFALLWAVVFVQMATGNDPVLGGGRRANGSSTTRPVPRAGSEEVMGAGASSAEGPEAATPETVEPEVAEPETVEPEFVEPEPETIEPEFVEPEPEPVPVETAQS
jgi:hypothetical protein